MEHVSQNLHKAICNPLRTILVITIILLAKGSIWANGIAPLAATPAWTAEGGLAGTKFGWSVASAGDVNHDGYDDVIVGAPFYENGQKREGKVFVFHGSANGLSTTPAWTMESNLEWAQFGYSVSSAGDVNGDGFADVIIGAPNYYSDRGRAYIYLGSPQGLSTTAAWVVNGEQPGALFGHAVSKAGDVNGDGFDDVIVGSPYSDLEPTVATLGGKAFLYLGSGTKPAITPAWTAECPQATALFGFSVAAAGDVNRDGYDDIYIGAPYYDHALVNEGQAYLYLGKATDTSDAAPLSPTPAWVIEGDHDGALLGFSIASAGDVNGDGHLDAIISAPYYGNLGSHQGKALLYLGSAAGFPPEANWWTVSNGGESNYVLLGWEVASAGDINKDGYDDIIIGAPYYSAGQTYEGQALVFLGSAAGIAQGTPDWTVESNQAQGILGSSAASAGDVNGDGAADVIIGIPGYSYYYNNIELKNWGRALLYTGIPSNTSPVAQNDQYVTAEDTSLVIGAPGVLGNDSDADGDALTVTDIATDGMQGTVSLRADGSFTYIPRANFHGDDGFNYSVGDSHGGEAAATVTITVNSVNDPPIAVNDSYSTDEDTPLALAAADGVLGNDSDIDGPQLTTALVAGPSHGNLTLNADGSFTYFPDKNHNGSDSFAYKAYDGSLFSPLATVTIIIKPVNDAPVAQEQTVTPDEDMQFPITLVAKDADDDALTYSVVDPPTHGVLTGTAPNLTYKPSKDYNGSDQFTFKANDGQADSNLATVCVTINPVNDPPVITAISAPCDPARTLSAINASASFTDIDGSEYVATWDWGDGSASSGDVTGPSAAEAGAVTGIHEYAHAGVYRIKLALKNGDFTVEALTDCYVVIYDPAVGFVTGGGWINSPQGACQAKPELTGKATFGFVARYQKGANIPTGQTEFQFKVADLNFHSSSYDWLVVAGCKAMYKGEGTINGAGQYRFLLSAIDGALPNGGGADKFRIKIWDKATGSLAYDNQAGAEDYGELTSLIAGGSIVIHQ